MPHAVALKAVRTAHTSHIVWSSSADGWARKRSYRVGDTSASRSIVSSGMRPRDAGVAGPRRANSAGSQRSFAAASASPLAPAPPGTRRTRCVDTVPWGV
eukprot:1047448-Prymnesium_polylepis.2